MKTKLFGVFLIVLFLFTPVYAQTGFGGKWSSDPAEVAAAESAARAALSAPPVVPPNTGAGAVVATRGLATLGSVQMDLSIAGNKVTGSIVLHDTLTLKITDGTFDGKVATLKTQHSGSNGSVLEDTWTAEMKDNYTFVVKMETHAAESQPNPGGSNIVPVTLHRVE